MVGDAVETAVGAELEVVSVGLAGELVLAEVDTAPSDDVLADEVLDAGAVETAVEVVEVAASLVELGTLVELDEVVVDEPDDVVDVTGDVLVLTVVDVEVLLGVAALDELVLDVAGVDEGTPCDVVDVDVDDVEVVLEGTVPPGDETGGVTTGRMLVELGGGVEAGSVDVTGREVALGVVVPLTAEVECGGAGTADDVAPLGGLSAVCGAVTVSCVVGLKTLVHCDGDEICG